MSYGGLSGTWDFAGRATQEKKHYEPLWWKMFVDDAGK